MLLITYTPQGTFLQQSPQVIHLQVLNRLMANNALNKYAGLLKYQ